jgi:hypothetical protein
MRRTLDIKQFTMMERLVIFCWDAAFSQPLDSAYFYVVANAGSGPDKLKGEPKPRGEGSEREKN